MDRHIKILLAGEGGQGIQTIAKLLTQTAFAQGLEIIYIPNFGVEQRGGVSIAFVQIGDKKIDSPKFKIADFALITSDRAYERVFGNLSNDTLIIFDPETVKENSENIRKSFKKSFEIPAVETAKKQFTLRNANIILLGAIAELLEVLDNEGIIEQMHRKFEKYYKGNPELRDLNQKAFEMGMSAVSGG